jgi:hypothetical protein
LVGFEKEERKEKRRERKRDKRKGGRRKKGEEEEPNLNSERKFFKLQAEAAFFLFKFFYHPIFF